MDFLKDSHPAAVIPPPVMKQLSTMRIGEDRQVRLALHESGVVTGILAPGQRLYGLAVDIGTTKLAAYLVDLENGQTVAKSGASNPQISYGEDVISRIAHANRGVLETAGTATGTRGCPQPVGGGGLSNRPDRASPDCGCGDGREHRHAPLVCRPADPPTW